jgi:type III secretion protein C
MKNVKIKMVSLTHRFVLSLIIISSMHSVFASEIRWKDAAFEYVANGKSLKDMLREFGAAQGYVVVVAKDVDGIVNGKFNLKPASLMDLLAASYGFIWHVEGKSIFISPANDLISDIISLTESEKNELEQALTRLNIAAARFPISFDASANTAAISGPSRYVDLVLKISRSIVGKRLHAADGLLDTEVPIKGAEVRIFPLRFAWAADRRFKVGNTDQNIAGVATVLQDLYRNDVPVNYGSAGVIPNKRTNTSFQRFRSTDDQGAGLFNDNKNELNLRDSRGEFSESRSANTGRLSQGLGVPKFRADSRMNAVIVRDFPDRMATHEATINAMDVKPGMVEIEARIIEVNSEEAESLGIDWRFRNKNIDLQFGRDSLPVLSWGTALADTAPSVGPNGYINSTPSSGGVLTTVLGDSGRFLISRVKALAEDGRANLLSSPKILTLDNVEAVMDDLNTFFVRVSGNLDVGLFDVSVGTSLHVTPLIINGDGEDQKIKLVVRIEDGSLSAQQIDQIPIVRRSTIVTQSIIPNGQSLLIAGYSYQSDASNGSSVPMLSSIPYLGRLFKNKSSTMRRVDRFFLITPKVVW